MTLDPNVVSPGTPDPLSLQQYVYADANPVDGFDPSGYADVPGYVYQRVGTMVHWMFSIYVCARAIGYAGQRSGLSFQTTFLRALMGGT